YSDINTHACVINKHVTVGNIHPHHFDARRVGEIDDNVWNLDGIYPKDLEGYIANWDNISSLMLGIPRKQIRTYALVLQVKNTFPNTIHPKLEEQSLLKVAMDQYDQRLRSS
ncbi:hypothetical protein EI555_000922, partial [Monodon monoceros]